MSSISTHRLRPSAPSSVVSAWPVYQGRHPVRPAFLPTIYLPRDVLCPLFAEPMICLAQQSIPHTVCPSRLASPFTARLLQNPPLARILPYIPVRAAYKVGFSVIVSQLYGPRYVSRSLSHTLEYSGSDLPSSASRIYTLTARRNSLRCLFTLPSGPVPRRHPCPLLLTLCGHHHSGVVTSRSPRPSR